MPAQKITSPTDRLSQAVPVGIYARVSTEDQVGGRFDSCESQAAVCREIIVKHRAQGWREFVTITDAAYSGGTMNRPGIQQMKRLIEAGEIKVLLVFKLERLSRNVDEFGPFRAFLNKHGCELVSATEDISEAEPEGRLKNNIILAVADFERRNTAKKVRIKMREQAKRGFWNGGLVPLGFNYDLNTQQLTPNPAESAVVTKIFEMAAQLVPLTDIANNLNAEGFRTKTRTFVRRDGSAHQVGGMHFRSDGLRFVISNPIYRGIIRFGGEEHAARHASLISPDLWERANAAANKLPPRERPSVMVNQDKNLHLLKGLAFCGHCRRALQPHDGGKRDPSGKPYRYYDCARIVRKIHEEDCPVGRIAAGALESVVFGFLAELGKHPEVTRAALAKSGSNQRADQAPLQASLAKTEKSLKEINQQVSNCVEALAAGGAEVLGDELKQRILKLREKRQELIVKREQARQDLRAANEETLNEERVIAAVRRLGDVLPHLEPREQKELATLLIERVDARAMRRAIGDGSHRSLQFEVKLSLPHLVQGMEEKIVVGESVRHPIGPRHRSLAFTIKAAVGAQGKFRASIILTPFEHRVTSVPLEKPPRLEAVRHPIHRATEWQRELQRDPTLEKQAIAAREKIVPSSVSHHLKLLSLPVQVQEFLRELKNPDAVRYFSLRKLHRLADETRDQQATHFNQLKQNYRAGISP